MAEYIERSAVLQNKTTMTEYDEGGWGAPVSVVRVEDIEAIPAADVAPVVRCKDCKWIDEDGDCAHEEMLDQSGYPKSVKKDFFCGHGEKRAFDGDYVKYGKRRRADNG